MFLIHCLPSMASMAQTSCEQSWGVGIRFGRRQMIMPDQCSEPCEQCGAGKDARPVINVMPDGCIAPSSAVGGHRLCIKCSMQHLRIDAQGGHLAWFEEPFRNGYMLFRVYNTRSGSHAHPDTNCIYRMPYTDIPFTFFPIQCVDCGRDIQISEHEDTVNSCKLMRGKHTTVENPVVADAADIDRKTKALLKAMGKQDGEVLVIGGDAKDARDHLYNMFATARLVADLEDLHKGHKYVLEKNGAVVSTRSRDPAKG